MDNLAHTLAGAALGQAGLKRKTGLGMATLMIAANLPDIDVLGLFIGENLAWRRGWTHGPLALVILPVLLALAIQLFDRWQTRRGTRPPGRLPVRFGWVLALAYIGILSHPLLDYLNVYGIRCLMPFSERWFYGDVLFIVDVWMWSVLAIGVWLSRRRERRDRPGVRRPAILALAAITAYTGAMAMAGRWAEQHAAAAISAQGLGTPQRVLASPVPVDPFRREILYELQGRYGFGEVRWSPLPRLSLQGAPIPTGMDHPAIARAAETNKEMADLLIWSRFPFARVKEGAGATEVILGDARYSRRPEDPPFTVRAVVPGRPEGQATSPAPR